MGGAGSNSSDFLFTPNVSWTRFFKKSHILCVTWRIWHSTRQAWLYYVLGGHLFHSQSFFLILGKAINLLHLCLFSQTWAQIQSSWKPEGLAFKTKWDSPDSSSKKWMFFVSFLMIWTIENMATHPKYHLKRWHSFNNPVRVYLSKLFFFLNPKTSHQKALSCSLLHAVRDQLYFFVCPSSWRNK